MRQTTRKTCMIPAKAAIKIDYADATTTRRRFRGAHRLETICDYSAQNQNTQALFRCSWGNCDAEQVCTED
jgi:hypothetical protein